VTLPGASAPGKLVISGEYVVLEGAEALVVAVNARAYARWSTPRADGSSAAGVRSPDFHGLPREAVVARSLVEALNAPVSADLHIDVEALRLSGKKLGLGSSAAASAAAAGAVYAQSHEALDSVRGSILDAAMRAHREIAPDGSGVDVAASVLGGVLGFRRRGPDPVDVETREISWPEALRLRAVWTGVEARTSELVSRVRALAERDPNEYRRAMSSLREASARLIDGVVRDNVRDTLSAVAAHARSMEALGEAAGEDIVTEPHRRIASLALAHGGAAKPSGAGGGDVALALFAEQDAAEAFAATCTREGLKLLSLALGAEGVRAEPTRLESDHHDA